MASRYYKSYPNRQPSKIDGWLFPFQLLALGLLLLLPALTFASASLGKLTAVNIATAENRTTITLDLTKVSTYKVFTLDSPPRIIIDLADVKLATFLQRTKLKNTPILQIRSGHPTANTLRIVLDLTKDQQPTTYLQNDLVRKIQQLLIVLGNPEKNTTPPKNNLQQTQSWLKESLAQTSDQEVVSHSELPKSKAINDIASEPTPKAQPTDQLPAETTNISKPVMTLPNAGRRAIVVIIDPGHGGKDPGTTGSLGVHEKDVVLAISLALRDILANNPAFHPVLTRRSDYFIPLRGRLAIARKNRGDLFIAIHADAYKDPYATGASVFALSAHGASTEAGRWLAEKENYSELGGVSLRDKSDMLRSVLIDLSQTATISASLQFGNSLLRQLRDIGNLHYSVVEQAPFMVLKSPDIPSVLVETGFLSNPSEQERLRNPVDQKVIAAALAKGIENYFLQNPIPGTLLAANTNK